MLSYLKSWKGAVEVNGVAYDSIKAVNSSILNENSEVHICLHPIAKKSVKSEILQPAEVKQYHIKVKRYMTQKSSPEFNFMAQWNNNVPMPLCIMTGTVEKETRGMVYMKLHGDMYAEKMTVCMKCGKPLTNPVSQYFGVGPECGRHNYVNPFNTEEELKAAVAEYRKKLVNTTWEGWVIKSAIIEKEPVH